VHREAEIGARKILPLTKDFFFFILFHYRY